MDLKETTAKKPNWVKRKVVWQLKVKVLRSSYFKALLVLLGVATYGLDVGLDGDSVYHWITMKNCHR